MRINSFLASFAFVSATALIACGGSQPPAEEPAPSEAKDDTEKDAPEKEEAKEDAKTDSKASDTSGPEVKRTAKDIITSPEVTFMFSFNNSEPKDKAEKACTSQAGEDPKKMALCMKKASSKFEADGMQFKKNDKGEWVWITLRRKGSAITTLHKVPIDFSDDKATSVVIKTIGKDTGKGPGKVPSEVKIEVPNEFQIALDDPTHGRMVYEAKIGIMSDEKAK